MNHISFNYNQESCASPPKLLDQKIYLFCSVITTFASVLIVVTNKSIECFITNLNLKLDHKQCSSGHTMNHTRVFQFALAYASDETLNSIIKSFLDSKSNTWSDRPPLLFFRLWRKRGPCLGCTKGFLIFIYIFALLPPGRVSSLVHTL